MGYNLRMTLLFLSMLISFLSQTPTEVAPIVYNHICTNTTTLTANSNYQSNVLRLLAYLSSKATSNLEFYYASVGNSVDMVYGLFLCRGDLPAADCQNCVVVATKEIVGYCTEEKVVMAWYSECILRYSNLYIFSTMASEPTSSISSTDTVSDPNRFDKLVTATMNGLASSFSNVAFGAKKFGTKEANFTASRTLYTLVQSMPDLSGYNCNRCLQIAKKNLSRCCTGMKSEGLALSSPVIKFPIGSHISVRDPQYILKYLLLIAIERARIGGPFPLEDHLLLGNIVPTNDIEDGDEVEVLVDCGPKIIVKKIGVYLVYERVVDGKDEDHAITVSDDEDDNNNIENRCSSKRKMRSPNMIDDSENLMQEKKLKKLAIEENEYYFYSFVMRSQKFQFE
ncbi:putative cysteine-rich receptor-like protein kinase 9 [Corylus avellana]|uniref:putative cysteine-rich receptor-like protein kinase 9 n=1 Tax=Corylus avellana TaxID=13451 RepID=UPI00286C3277|nr:putative cysteine-rich receptor-like protein kinase 9 [Corylus avellana]